MTIELSISSHVAIVLSVVLALYVYQLSLQPKLQYQPVQNIPPLQSKRATHGSEDQIIQAPFSTKNKPPEINFRPVIGIIAQSAIDGYSTFGHTLVFPAHVKWTNMGGANVVPIWTNKSPEYYERMIKKINGIYLPGGSSHPTESKYGKSAKILLDLAIKLNDDGVYFPVWATCLGHQFLLCDSCGDTVTYPCEETFKKTKFIAGPDYEDSFIKENVPTDVLPTLFDKAYMPHMHHNCISMKTYNESDAAKSFFKVVSVNVDDNGTEYISTLQARNYPFYGVQWHPEKFSYHWNIKAKTQHSGDAIRLGQVFANFWVSEARRNDHFFFNNNELDGSLIQNFQTSFIGAPGYADFYFFTLHDASDEGLKERQAKIRELRVMRDRNWRNMEKEKAKEDKFKEDKYK